MAKKKRIGQPKKLDPLANQIEKSSRNNWKVKGKIKQKDNKFVSKRFKKQLKGKIVEKAVESNAGLNAKESSKLLRLAKEQRDELNNINDNESVASENIELEEIDETVEVQDVYDELEISKDDQNIMDQYFNIEDKPKSRTLGDIIFKKMEERKAMQAQEETHSNSTLSVEVIEVYENVGKIMKRYRSGKVPKALKVIPNLQNWEEVLEICNFYEFSNQATFILTRLMCSNLNERHAQKYYFNYLLPKIREDIRYSPTKVLNCHLFNSLKKALYKPAAFFKGIVIPLTKDSQTTLREAAIISSALNNCSIPMLHSAASVLSILETYKDTQNFMLVAPGLVFLKVLLNKKYNFPQRVVDELVLFFFRFKNNEPNSLPVLWHQCVLVFIQRYKTSLTKQQQNAIKTVIKSQFHHQITPEIRREILAIDN